MTKRYYFGILFLFALLAPRAFSQEIKFFLAPDEFDQEESRTFDLGGKYHLKLFIYNINPKKIFDSKTIESALKEKVLADIFYVQKIIDLKQSPNNADIWELGLDVIWLKKNKENTYFNFLDSKAVFDLASSSLAIKQGHIKNYIQLSEITEKKTLALPLIASISIFICFLITLSAVKLKNYIKRRKDFLFRKNFLNSFRSIENKKDLNFFCQHKKILINLFKDSGESINKCFKLLEAYLYKENVSAAEIIESRLVILNLINELEKKNEHGNRV